MTSKFVHTSVQVRARSLLAELLAEYGEAHAAKKTAEERNNTVVASLKVALNKAAPADTHIAASHGGVTVHMDYTEYNEFDTTQFKIDYPEMYAQYLVKRGKWVLTRAKS
jgi:hypothetical protein